MHGIYDSRLEIDSLKEQLAINSTRTAIVQKTKAEELHETLLKAFPLAFDDDIIEEVKQQVDYPYWHKSSFNINMVLNDGDLFAKKFRFMEEEDGGHISQQCLDSICTHLADAFKIIKMDMPSLVIEGWRNINKELALACYADLRHTFDEFTLCSNDWKANSFLMEWYPNVTRSRPRKERKGKSVDAANQDDVEIMEDRKHIETENEDNMDPTEASVPSKCPGMSNVMGIPRKRAKTIEGPRAMLKLGGMPMAMDPLCASFYLHAGVLICLIANQNLGQRRRRMLGDCFSHLYSSIQGPHLPLHLKIFERCHHTATQGHFCPST
jgi:hypothetical protein